MRARNKQRALGDEVARLVERSDWVTFVQLAQFLEARAVPCRGPVNLTLSCDRNVLLWSGMSTQMSGVVLGLLDQRRIFAHRSSVAAYHVHGGVLNLPLADRPQPTGLARPHWLPVAFRTVPPGWAMH
jgi:hypothetical protein